MIHSTNLKVLEKIINKTLQLDRYYQEKLVNLSGKTLKVIIQPLDQAFYIRASNSLVYLSTDCHQPVDTTIESTLSDLIQLTWLSNEKARALMTSAIKITGDIRLAQEIKQLIDEIEIDWEGYIAHFTGDVIAHHLGTGIRKKVKLLQKLFKSTTKNISDYLHHEWQGVVSAEELEDFYHETAELSLAVERLEAQIRQIKKL